MDGVLEAWTKGDTPESHDKLMRERMLKLNEELENSPFSERASQYTHCFECCGWGGHGPSGLLHKLLMAFCEIRKPCEWTVVFGPKGIGCIDFSSNQFHQYDVSNIYKVKSDWVSGSCINVTFNNHLPTLVLAFPGELAAQKPAKVIRRELFNESA